MFRFKRENGKFVVRNEGRVNVFDTLYDALLYIDYVRFLHSVKLGVVR